jgi:hypothetical protein
MNRRPHLAAGRRAPSHLQQILAEALEPRGLLSAPAAGASLQQLMGYDQLGATWDYASQYTATIDGDTTSDSGSASVNVRSDTGTFDGHQADLVDVTTGDGSATATTAWYSDSKGSHLAALITSTEQGTFSLDLHGALAAPASLAVGGKAFRSSGKFTGTFNVDAGVSLSGSVSGKVQNTSQLIGTQVVDEPAGSFTATQGKQATTVNGTMTVRYQGHTYHLGYSSTVSQTFWTVEGVGVVKMTQELSVTLNEGGHGVGADVVTASDLTDFSGVASSAGSSPFFKRGSVLHKA